MYVGVDYYPEHWPRERWVEDAELMQQAGFNVTRLAEFAWAQMEPEEGRFEFEWLDDALAVLAGHGISAILGTPTGAMPAWMAHDYPETAAMRADGTRIPWGARKNNCFSNPDFRRFSRQITRAMALHFKDAPSAIGWQIDNEFGGTQCFCEICRRDFQEWLERKYKSLDALNRAWGTHFWGQTVGKWEHIFIPSRPDSHNPSACLDWRRFFSDLTVDFQREQVEVLRELCPNHFVTHNLMGLHPALNYYDLASDLDFVSWDSYPVGGQPGIRSETSMAADLMRGIKRRNYWIMEQTAGPRGWSEFQRNPRPGEIRSVAFQHLAHGCDGHVWFRWRTCTAGREQYWHGLLGHDGRPLRRYEEIARTSAELRKLASVLDGTTVRADVAIVYDYDSLWALAIQPGYAGNDLRGAIGRYYNALFRVGVNVDFIPANADLSSYRLVLAPDLYVLPDGTAKRLDEYVRQGGVLLADCRTGVKDENNLCHPRTLPGLLSPALGIEIQEYEGLAEGMSYEVRGTDRLPGSFKAVRCADWVTAKEAERLAGYEEWHMEAFAAVTCNVYGEGTGWYVGTVVEPRSFYDQLIDLLLRDAGIEPIVAPPDGVEASVLEGEGRKLLFLLNHTEKTRDVAIPAGKKELLSGRTTAATFTLDRFGVAVVLL